MRQKLSIISKLDLKERAINDFVPLLDLNIERLKQICQLIAAERDQIPGGNRIYYFSDKLKVLQIFSIKMTKISDFIFLVFFQIDPNVVARYFVKNDYFLVAPFENVDRKVQILLDYNIKPISILKSLYALDRSEEVYVSRLERLMSLNARDVKVWLFKCADDVFETYLSKMKRMRSLNNVNDKIEPKTQRKIKIENKLNEMLECDSKDAAHIYYNQISNFDQIDSAKENIEFLMSQGISLETITANPAVLTMSIGLYFLSQNYHRSQANFFIPILDQLKNQLRLLDEIGSKHIDDIFPLICVNKSELEKFNQVLCEEELYGPDENPIYYFSERLNVSSHYFFILNYYSLRFYK